MPGSMPCKAGAASRSLIADAMHADTEFLPAALEIQEHPPSPAGRAILWAIMMFFCIAVIWTFIGEIDIVATAQGKIVPSGRVKVIQPIEIGVVYAIHVSEGQLVSAGDLLIELDPTSTRADVERLERELAAAQLDAARYQALIRISRAEQPVDNELQRFKLILESGWAARASAEAIVLQEQLLKSEWSGNRARIAALTSTIASREADLAATQSEVRKRAGTLPLITRRANALEPLLEKNLVSEHAWLELEEQRIEQQQELDVLKNRVRQVAASIREARQQKEADESEFIRNVLVNLTETGRHIDNLQQERIKATQRTALQQLRAPVSGVVQQLAVHTIGGVVTPAQELMRIIPQDQSLEVEAWILNRDVGFVAEGQKAEVKVETFPFTRYGVIDAEIIDVSNDAISDEDKGLIYAGRVLLKESVMRVGEKLVNLSPGMAVTVEVKTGTRRLIDFILSPLLRYRDESLGER